MIPCSEEEYFYKVDNMVLCSTQHIRNVFKARWKTESGEEWVDEQNYILNFLQGLGENVAKKAKPSQKSSIHEWDMTFVSMIIQTFGDKTKYETENTAVRKLKDIRNDLAHHQSHKLTKDEYNKYVKIFRDSLHSLNMMEGDIDKLVERMGVTSSLQALEAVKILYKKAEHYLKLGKMDKAIKIFTEAISTPSLLPEDHGEAYEKRADCYLKSVKNLITDGNLWDEALLDLNQALELNRYSWNAHYLAAKCYRRKNNLPEAIRHLQKSVAISPAEKHVKQELDSCKWLDGLQGHHLDPNVMPMNLSEHLQNHRGEKLTEKEFLSQGKILGSIIKGQNDVFLGIQYRFGWGVSQNYSEAARCYAKADDAGNPEGSYYLASSYLNGHGVDQDVEKALTIFKRVAKMNKNTLGEVTPLGSNLGVASSQHVLGLLYSRGIGVEKNYTKAVFWHKKAMENGMAKAANDLGFLYHNGLGISFDEKMAELCWKQAINLRDVNATHSLFAYYVNQWEPDKAIAMLEIGRQMGNAQLIATPDDTFRETIAYIRGNILGIEPDLKEFESVHNLQSKGMTFTQRSARFLRQEAPRLEMSIQIAKRNATGRDVDMSRNGGGSVQSMVWDHLETIEKMARDGSVTARRHFQTASYNMELITLLADGTKLTDNHKMSMVQLLYNIITLEQHIAGFPPDLTDKLETIIAELFEKNCQHKGEDDMKIRLCYANFNLKGSFISSNDKYSFRIMKEGLRRYPENVHYYERLTMCCGFKKMYKEGRLYAEEGLKLFPNDVELMFDRAVHVNREEQLRHSKPTQGVQAFKDFLSVAPADHRKVPEACYNISYLYSYQYLMGGRNDANVRELVIYWYQRAQDAEKDQLPIYLPYGESDVKAHISINLDGNPSSQQQTNASTNIRQNLQFVSVLERKEYLKGPTRKGMLLKHRASLKKINHQFTDMEGGIKYEQHFLTTATPKLKQTVVKKMSGVKPITLIEMNPSNDHIYVNRTLELTIIDDINTNFVCIGLIAEDDDGDTTRLNIYNVKKDAASLARFQPGCKIAIINPYMRIGAVDVSHCIRNDEPRCIIYLGKVENMCRFCGEENAQKKCSKCKRQYCSKECQTLDWKEMDHKLICV